MSRSRKAMLAMLAVTAIWGSTFFIIKGALDFVDPFDYLAIRFVIAAVFPALIFFKSLRGLSIRQWATALGLGALYGLAQIAQTVGLQYTSASVSGFITGSYVVLTPMLLWVMFRTKPSRSTGVAVFLAVIGLAVLSLSGLEAGGMGELLTLLGAALYALHIILLDRSSRSMNAKALTVGQLFGVALIALVFAAPGGISMPSDANVWAAILYTAIIAGVVTMLLQTWAQRHLSPTRIALLMTVEPVFASMFAMVFGGEALTMRLVIGGSLIFIASYIGIRGGHFTPHIERAKLKALLQTLREEPSQVFELAGSITKK